MLNRVAPFGHLRITGCLPPPRSLSQAATSFIAVLCQGIHHLPLYHPDILSVCSLNLHYITHLTLSSWWAYLLPRFNCQRSGIRYELKKAARGGQSLHQISGAGLAVFYTRDGEVIFHIALLWYYIRFWLSTVRLFTSHPQRSGYNPP